MDCIEADGGDEATEADNEHGGDEPRVGVRRDATKVGQAHEVAEDVPAGRVGARVGAGGGWGQEARAARPGARPQAPGLGQGVGGGGDSWPPAHAARGATMRPVRRKR